MNSLKEQHHSREIKFITITSSRNLSLSNGIQDHRPIFYFEIPKVLYRLAQVEKFSLHKPDQSNFLGRRRFMDCWPLKQNFENSLASNQTSLLYRKSCSQGYFRVPKSSRLKRLEISKFFESLFLKPSYF